MKTVIWDVDDVLNDLMRCWFEKSWLLSHPECTLTYEDLTQNPPSKEGYLRWLGKADILVDDRLFHIEVAEKLGIAGVLMPRPWNKSKVSITGTMSLLTRLTS